MFPLTGSDSELWSSIQPEIVYGFALQENNQFAKFLPNTFNANIDQEAANDIEAADVDTKSNNQKMVVGNESSYTQIANNCMLLVPADSSSCFQFECFGDEPPPFCPPRTSPSDSNSIVQIKFS